VCFGQISLGGEGNALYPVLSCSVSTSAHSYDVTNLACSLSVTLTRPQSTRRKPRPQAAKPSSKPKILASRPRLSANVPSDCQPDVTVNTKKKLNLYRLSPSSASGGITITVSGLYTEHNTS